MTSREALGTVDREENSPACYTSMTIMAGVNKAIILGHLGRDPELRYIQSGQPVCSLNIATSRKYTNKQNEQVEETEWHRVSVWGKQAEHCNNFLTKGRQVYVEGRLRTSSYDKDGQKHYTTEIVADTVQFIGGGEGGQGGGERRGGGQGGGGYGQRQTPPGPADSYPFDDSAPAANSGDDDIPF